MEAKLESVVARLEAVALKLEKLGVGLPIEQEEESEDFPAVNAYDETFNPLIEKIINSSKALNPELVEMSQLIVDLMNAVRRVILAAQKCSKPTEFNPLEKIAELSAIGIKWCDTHFKTKFINNLKATNEMMTLLTWPTIGASAEQFVQEMTGAVEFNTNKISREFLNKDANHMGWVQGVVGICKKLPTYINDFQKGGIKWNTRGKPAKKEDFELKSGGQPAPKQETPKPEPPKPVAPKPEPPKQETPKPQPKLNIPVKAAPAKTPAIRRIGEKQIQVEYFDGQVPEFPPLNIEDIVNIFQCKNCDITIPSKVKAISLLNCERCVISPKDVIGVLEMNGVKKTKFYLEGTIKTITVDKSDSIEIYVNEASKNLQLISALSTGINLEYPDPKEEGNYIEHAVPEQIIVHFNEQRQLQSEVYVHK